MSIYNCLKRKTLDVRNLLEDILLDVLNRKCYLEHKHYINHIISCIRSKKIQHKVLKNVACHFK